MSYSKSWPKGTFTGGLKLDDSDTIDKLPAYLQNALDRSAFRTGDRKAHIDLDDGTGRSFKVIELGGQALGHRQGRGEEYEEGILCLPRGTQRVDCIMLSRYSEPCGPVKTLINLLSIWVFCIYCDPAPDVRFSYKLCVRCLRMLSTKSTLVHDGENEPELRSERN
jgi:hypothetical protein